MAGSDEANTGVPFITFRASRIKHMPAPILFAPMALFFAVPLYKILRVSSEGRSMGEGWLGFIIMLALFLTGVYVELRMIADILWPQRIFVTTDGWSITTLGTTVTRRWSDFGEAKENRVSMGRSSQRCITLVSKIGEKSVNIMTLGYPYSIYDMLKTIQFAQAGRLVDPGEADFPWSYVLIGIPLAIAAAVGLTAYFGPTIAAMFL